MLEDEVIQGTLINLVQLINVYQEKETSSFIEMKALSEKPLCISQNVLGPNVKLGII